MDPQQESVFPVEESRAVKHRDSNGSVQETEWELVFKWFFIPTPHPSHKGKDLQLIYRLFVLEGQV